MPDLPNFIVNKLVAKDSCKISPNSFTFALNNTFAPATIIGFALEIEGKRIPPGKVTFSPAGGQARSADGISAEAPFPFSVGSRYTVSVENISITAGRLRVMVNTVEAGEVTFNLNLKERDKSPSRAIQFKFPKLFNLPLKASASVEAGAVIGEIHPRVYGHFIEHLERCIYDGIWTADGSSLRADTVALIKALKPTVMRYPGGNFASGYHWEDGIGPKSARPARTDKAWNAPESNQVGTDEYMAFCRAVGTEPFLVVNDGSGTPEEAARWVEYCNASTGEQARRRAANGHPAPYGVRLWGVGNEVWGKWQIGTTSAENYAERLIRFVDAMRAADPNIEIVAVGDRVASDRPDDPGALWNAAVLRAAADRIDHLAFHIYQPDQDGWRDDLSEDMLHRAICAAPLDSEDSIRRMGAQVAALAPDRRIGISFDEWNVWPNPPADSRSMHDLNYCQRDALYAAGIFNAFHRQCGILSIANLAQLVNVLPLIRTDASRAYPTPLYHVFWMYQFMQKLALKANIQSPVFSTTGLGNTITARNGIPYFDMTATRSQDGLSLTLGLVNRHADKKLTADISLRGFGTLKPVKTHLLAAGNPLAVNTFDKPDNVRVTEIENPEYRSETLKVHLPASSVMVIIFG